MTLVTGGSCRDSKGIDGIRQFQVIQEEHGRLVLKLVPGEGFSEEVTRTLTGRIKARCGDEMGVEIELVEEIPPTPSGKRKCIISKVSPYIT